MDLALLRVVPLAGKSALDRFDCGDYDINGFAKKAHKFNERNRARIFCGHLGEALWGLGFYSLSVMVEDKKKLGTRQADVYDFGAPLIYIDALGVRLPYQRAGLGRMLLIDALKRAHSVSKNVAVYGVALRSLNDRTTAFYRKHGFGVIEDGKTPLMVVPIWTLEDLFEGG